MVRETLERLSQFEGDDPEDIPDDRLRLIFTCCHPALELKSRVALTLRTVCGLSTGEIARLANNEDKEIDALAVTAADVAELAQLVESGKINDRIGREVLAAVLAGEGSPATIVAAKGLEVVSDDGALLAAIDEALASQPDVIDAIREGRMQAAGAVIGAVMKAMKGQADAARVRELLIQRASE